jgi:hypothetical protein
VRTEWWLELEWRGGGGVKKPLAADQGEKGSQRGSLACSGAKCTLRAAVSPGGGKSRKRTAAGGQPLALGCAGGAVGSVEGFSRMVDILSFFSPMHKVRWCRDRLRRV